MAEYILRDQAIIAVTGAKLPDVSASGLPIANGKRSVTDCVRRLKEIPAADVRPVVLCRDCKRYGGRPWENNESGICARTDVGVGEFDFCSYGVKLEES